MIRWDDTFYQEFTQRSREAALRAEARRRLAARQLERDRRDRILSLRVGIGLGLFTFLYFGGHVVVALVRGWVR